jgi:carbamoylphosphate synthase large subunit
MTSPEQFHRLRSTQPSRPSSEAYAQMERMRAASMKENGRVLNGERSSSGALKPAISSLKK